ncbi:MAG: Maf family protein [Bacteroides sp.]|nr:Maf family protein [Prevotella sp.]MCM1408227.1 Maf family protein [Treponema brennaborense]MCM1469551.1 Maf family protein [Bacteroides sp.]
MEPIILASSSPRRQAILKDLGVPFKVVLPETDETLPAGTSPEEAAELLAIKKVNAVTRNTSAEQAIPWILGADTLVALEGTIYGKPKDTEQAAHFLRQLSGKTHTVITSIALFNGKLNYLSTRTNKTSVTFAQMSAEEIEWYIGTGEWHGAAGGYRIQEMGSCFITHISGSYSSVIGLPIFEFYDILKEHGYSFLD